DFEFLKDSLINQLNPNDLKDSISDCCDDGITVYIFSTFQNSELKETELVNYFTANQKRLINFTLEIINKNNYDITTEKYLTKLKRQFK
ncbi:hypothetical protein, partial [Marinifilum caeruleilacunae]|uniref:hypothetical protein n=1 Tax=Marinifilum caeruleilacunae TaxID=2499076 RepID=UPI001C1159C4